MAQISGERTGFGAAPRGSRRGVGRAVPERPSGVQRGTLWLGAKRSLVYQVRLILSLGVVLLHMEKFQKPALSGVLKHNARVWESRGFTREHIDNSKLSLDWCPGIERDDPEGFAASRIESLNLKRKPRENAVRMVEWVCTLPEGETDQKAFFGAAYKALAKEYGEQNVIGAWVHCDEPGARPHMHFDFVPVTQDGRLSAKSLMDRSHLKQIHPRIQREVSEALGHEVHLLLPEEERGRKQLSRLNIEEYKAAVNTLGKAEQDAARAAERAAGADKAAQAAERAQKAAEDRKRAAEAAAEASERATAQASDAAKAAKEDMQRQRDFAKRLGNQGKGIDWHYPDGHIEHESSVGEVRTERDAAKAEAAAAMKKKDELLAFADEIRGERYEIDGRTYKGISALADELKGLRAETAAAEKELAAAQGKAASARQAAAQAEADRKAAEAAKAQAEALLSSLRDSEKEARARAQKWQERSLAHYHEMHLTPDDLLDALRTMACRVADVVCQLWVRARDIAIQEWDIWQTRDLPKAAGDMGIYIGDAFDISDRAMRETAEAYGHPEIADDLLDMPGQSQERGYDDWER